MLQITCYANLNVTYALRFHPSSENAISKTESELQEANFNIFVHGSKTHLTLQCHPRCTVRTCNSSHAAAISPPCGRESI
jgi:hypothetical protein